MICDNLQRLVKQKAQKNYFDKVVGTSKNVYRGILSDFITVRSATSSKLVPMTYSYNWPYDYCTFVEMVKIEATPTIKLGEPTPTSVVENEAKEAANIVAKAIEDLSE